MKNIIEKDGKFWVKCSLVMLPATKGVVIRDFDDNHLYLSNQTTELFGHQQLYLINDEEIEEGDWFTDDNKTLKQSYKLSHVQFSNAKKIIATTNPELTEIIECNGTPYVFKIPKIPQSFIQEFVKNQGNGYDEILIEVVVRTFNNIISEPQYYYEIQLYSNNEINIL